MQRQSVPLAFFHGRHNGRRARQLAVLLAVGMMVLLVAVPAVLAAPDMPEPSDRQAIIEQMPDFLPELAFVLLSSAAMFVIYLRSRLRRIRKLHEMQ